MFAGSGIPQGSTKCEHQRIKDRPPPTWAANLQPVLPCDGETTPECPEDTAYPKPCQTSQNG